MPIVEGHGEVAAVPVLLRRMVALIAPGVAVDIPRPIRIPRDRLIRVELERAVELAARKAGTGGGILVLLDADDDCPAQLGPQLLERAQRARPESAVCVVMAKSEFESWLIAGCGALARDLAAPLTVPEQPEHIRDAKGWLRSRTRLRSYRPTRDQASFAARFDLEAARTTASFDKLWRDIESLVRRVTANRS